MWKIANCDRAANKRKLKLAAAGVPDGSTEHLGVLLTAPQTLFIDRQNL